jgi:uncharacterized damage-inducible protein DinB
MPIQQLKKQFNVLLHLIGNLSPSQYEEKAAMLGGVSIGQHVRHIVEMVQCLLQGYASGKVDYEARKRDIRIETDIQFAADLIHELLDKIDLDNKTLELKQDGTSSTLVTTFYYRELIYNTEHALHHMALIRVALREMGLEIVDEHFGVAPSTVRYQRDSEKIKSIV